MVPLDSPYARRAAGMCRAGAGKAILRADLLCEVLVDGAVRREAVSDVMVIDFTRQYGRRMVRFTKDYFNMVAPKVIGAPAYDCMCVRMLAEFEPEGACLSADGEVMLPKCVLDEFRANARMRGWSAGE